MGVKKNEAGRLTFSIFGYYLQPVRCCQGLRSGQSFIRAFKVALTPVATRPKYFTGEKVLQLAKTSQPHVENLPFVLFFKSVIARGEIVTVNFLVVMRILIILFTKKFYIFISTLTPVSFRD